MAVPTLRRNLAPRLGEFTDSFRAVVLGGARQVGKTTLLTATSDFVTVSLDDPALLAAAASDPIGFLQTLQRPAVIDEFQRGGEGLLLAIKAIVDRDNQRGQFVLSGSANYLANRAVTETLAGRAGRLTLWPLSLGERSSIRETFIDRLFEPEAWPPAAPQGVDRGEIIRLILQGGYPEIVTQDLREQARHWWFESYLADVISKEALRPIAEVRLETELRRVFRLLAARTGGELVISDLARDAELARETTANYVALLEALYLIVLVPGWSSSVATRAKRRSKILVTDSGLAADAAGIGAADFRPGGKGVAAGALFESMVIAELYKQSGWSERSVDLLHFRDRNGAEVDCIVQDRRSQQITGVEVKLTATPTGADARHLAMLRDRLGEQFVLGVVVHGGDRVVPLGERLWGVPLMTLCRND